MDMIKFINKVLILKHLLNLELQNLSIKIIKKRANFNYDKRKGWRGPLDNRKVKIGTKI